MATLGDLLKIMADKEGALWKNSDATAREKMFVVLDILAKENNFSHRVNAYCFLAVETPLGAEAQIAFEELLAYLSSFWYRFYRVHFGEPLPVIIKK